MLDVNGWEFVLLLLIGVVVLGPERLPEYAAKLGRLVRQARAMAEGARGQLREQMGPEFDDINWRQYDPRQYDPRRIVREALLDPDPVGSTTPEVPDPRSPSGYDAALPTPYDADAT